jgi:hypothetical protein
MAETALVLPVLFLLVLGTIQVALLGYGTLMARYAAFVSIRRASVLPADRRESAARSVAGALLAGAPAVRFTGASFRQAVLPLRGVAGSGSMERWTLTVRARVPRLVPFPRSLDLSTVAGTASMAGEPRW